MQKMWKEIEAKDTDGQDHLFAFLVLITGIDVFSEKSLIISLVLGLVQHFIFQTQTHSLY